ncbi:2-nitropropane dioxygenase [Mycobacterium sp. E2462]|uniref:nitronate monooxygenase n=1 Tax=Mycobacterium sp. E2462 TaxID=1834133 RepID=UPI0008018602|nr:nitronate monooxygenase [Mycobacterium sp. E2462]OBI18864.1 2-nitropropane dioxygenase [Mycobacterium sp. E2462]
MSDRFALRDLSVAVLAAPMAGGPSTPALAAAVTDSGGLGFLAGGLVTPDGLSDAIVQTRDLTAGPVGVNLFVPQPRVADADELARFAAHLAPLARECGTELGEPRHDDDHWDAKLDVVCDLRPEVVSFTFGPPGRDTCRRLRELGIVTVATVTTVAEALIAVGDGVDALVVQGPAAGGHRATYDARQPPAADPLDTVVAELVDRFACPVIAAGGVGDAADVRRLRKAGAAAVQVGTAFLLADEAGTNPLYRSALRDPEFTRTVITRAFTGRYARALANRFVETYDGYAVCGFPEIARMTAPLQAASLRAGDPHGVAMWAGSGFRAATAGPAGDIVGALRP